MATLNQITYDILGDIKGSNIIDDSHIETDRVKYLIHQQRSMWLNRRLTKPGYYITPDMTQDLKCVPVELTDAAECCDVTVDCSIMRTESEIPAPLNINSTVAITRVGPVNKLQSMFSFVDYERAIWSGNGRFNDQHIFAFYLNKRIYLKFNDVNRDARMLEYLNVQGVFEDPDEVKTFTDCSGEPCHSDDSEYPIPDNLIPFIKDHVIKQLLRNEQMPEDQKNDANEQVSTGGSAAPSNDGSEDQ